VTCSEPLLLPLALPLLLATGRALEGGGKLAVTAPVLEAVTCPEPVPPLPLRDSAGEAEEEALADRTVPIEELEAEEDPPRDALRLMLPLEQLVALALALLLPLRVA